MDSLRCKPPRARWVATAGFGLAIGLVGAGWVGSAAWASPHAHASSGSSGRRKHHSTLPVIGNATNLKREPVVHATKGTPPTKLEIKNLVVGTGATATRASTVRVKYVGADYKTGKDFTQASWTAKRPLSFSLSGVIAGFGDGLVGMKVGGRREIVIPPSLGYGPTGTGTIEPNETLVFVVDLKGVSG